MYFLARINQENQNLYDLSISGITQTRDEWVFNYAEGLSNLEEKDGYIWNHLTLAQFNLLQKEDEPIIELITKEQLLSKLLTKMNQLPDETVLRFIDEINILKNAIEIENYGLVHTYLTLMKNEVGSDKELLDSMVVELNKLSELLLMSYPIMFLPFTQEQKIRYIETIFSLLPNETRENFANLSTLIKNALQQNDSFLTDKLLNQAKLIEGANTYLIESIKIFINSNLAQPYNEALNYLNNIDLSIDDENLEEKENNINIAIQLFGIR